MSYYREDKFADNLKEQLKKLIDEMPEDEFLDFTKQVLSQTWMQGQLNVLCELQNNMKLISRVDAKQCTTCSKWFCRDHNLKNCTHCNASMP
jgi:hypothetical protein